jgi:SNF2 family DNA or RNA helicase
MLADEMGLGKTIQTLGYIARHPDFTVVVVCPSAVKVQWKREAEKWLDCGKGVVEIAEGRSPRTPALACGILIINYDVLPYWQDKLIEWDADLLVLDESVYVKERKSKRSIAAVALAKQARHVLALSGRPVLNKPYELWNQLAIVRPDLPFGSWTAFNTRYSGYHKDHWGWQMGAAANLEELEFRLRANVMIQRKKIEVLTELPDLDRVTVALEVEPPETLDISTIEDITAARKEAGLLKLLPAIQWLQEAKENLGQIVVFAHHHDVTGTLAAALEAPPPIDGRMPQKERQKWVDRFQAGLEPILVCGTRAMGMGVNMQAGSTCVFVELDWTMAAHEQAESRLHRMGQKNAVTAYYLVAEGTIDEPIMQMLSDKQTITEKVVGEEPTVRVLDRLKEIIEKRGA